MTKYKISNLFDIIMEIVGKCCSTHCQGSYTKDIQGHVFKQYQNIWKKESFGYLLSQEIKYQTIKILCFVKSTGQQIFGKLFIMWKNDQEIPPFCVKITMLGTWQWYCPLMKSRLRFEAVFYQSNIVRYIEFAWCMWLVCQLYCGY